MSILFACCVIGLSQQFLLASWLARAGLKSIGERLFLAYMLSASAYLIKGIVDSPPWITMLLTTLYTASAGLFWLLCIALFNDSYKFKWWHIALVASTTLLPLSHGLIKPESGVWRLALVSLPQVVEYVLIILGLFAAAAYWRDDLVKERRVVRAWVLGVCGTSLLGIVVSIQIFGSHTWWVSPGSYLITAINALVLNIYLGGLRENTLFALPKAPSPVVDIVEEGDVMITKLKQQMDAGIYREMGLTIGALGKSIGIQEHQLRRIINKQLGYRNFNDFLNSYRVEEAAQSLKRESLPILTIALDCGFRSLSTFNQAFKQAYAVTPSQYRKSPNLPE